jgi:hypothetical protein
MTSTVGAFVSNAASRAHTRVAFAQNATIGIVSAVIGCFASAQAVACRFSLHEATCSIAHRLAECAHATLLSSRKKARDALGLVGQPGIGRILKFRQLLICVNERLRPASFGMRRASVPALGLLAQARGSGPLAAARQRRVEGVSISPISFYPLSPRAGCSVAVATRRRRTECARRVRGEDAGHE